jgi:[ribosomal protein S18]-alanine N-acetyltransferase
MSTGRRRLRRMVADSGMVWSAPKSRLGPSRHDFDGLVGLGEDTEPCTLRAAQPEDLDRVLALEAEAYAFPWTHRNFLDSISSGYDFWALEDAHGLLAYALVMWLPDEAHLLNITVRPDRQDRGLGRRFLTWILNDVTCRGAQALMLEVRPTNPRALALYGSMGFNSIGVRKGYYPSWNNSREDALVLSKALRP